MRIWIDLSNSPHPLLFAPIGRSLEERGHTVLVTSRDNAQTLELAREHWPDVEPIGTRSPPGRPAKARAIVNRIRELRRWATAARPDVAVSHNSYAQIAAAASLRLPIVTAMDYEHQPANHLAFRLADRILLPEALPLDMVRRQGASPRRVRRYPGLKEEVYLGDFEPDREILSKVGIDAAPGDAVVVVRAPPTGAMYHQFGNPLYESVMSAIAARPATHSIVLTRHPEQRAALAERRLPGCIVPDRALDSRSLLFCADLFIGAGGTMTREAALMRVPAFSIYAGPPPAIERWLEGLGLLRTMASPADLDRVQWGTDRAALPELRHRARQLTDFFVDAILETGSKSTTLS
jgi:predicted glycosyltransferase